MMTIEINYNSISFELNIKCNSNTILNNLEAEIKNNNEKRITDWFEAFLKRLKEETNYEPFTIDIDSCDEYEKNFIEEVLKGEIKVKSKIKFLSTEAIEEKYQFIDKFIDIVLKSEDEIVKRTINPHKENIERLRCNKVEVPVIATMSSGKSTLLNALIGQDFLHEDTWATTATTCTIKVNNELEQFTASVINNEEIQESTEKETNIANFLREKNKQSNENQSIELFLEGPVSGIDTKGFDFRFIDTPGPNSAKNENHKEKTFTFLKDNQNLPIVLYVLDPEKMDSKDDEVTLKEIGDILKDNQQNLERIIFVCNKIDRVDIEDKSMNDILEKVEKFLKDNGIAKPKIFPVSAEYAKYTQLENTLTKSKKSQLRTYRDKFIYNIDEDYKGYELLDHSPLRNSQKEILQRQINNGGVDTDLVYSGLAALKFYIEDYITSHHLKNQYKEFQSIVNNVCKQIGADIKLEREQLEKDSEEQREEQKKKEEDELVNLNNKKEEAIKEIQISKIDKKFIHPLVTNIDKTFDNIFDKAMRKNEINPEEAKNLIKDINAEIKNLQVSIKTTIESKMNDETIKYVEKLKNIVADKFEVEKNMRRTTVNSFSAEMMNNISSINLHQVEKYENQKTEIRTREVKRNTLIAQWFLGSKIEEYVVAKKVVDVRKFYKDQVDPIKIAFQKIIENCESYIKNTETNLKEQFNKKINEFFHEAENRVYRAKAEFIYKAGERKEKVKYLTQLEKIFTI